MLALGDLAIIVGTSLLAAAVISAVAVLVLHIVLTLLQANPANVVAALIARLAGTFDLGLSNLFLVDDPMLAVLLNYGAAAVASSGVGPPAPIDSFAALEVLLEGWEYLPGWPSP